MKTLVDARLRIEARSFALRFACDDCVHFNLVREACALGYPASPRRGALEADAETQVALSAATEPRAATIEFCKEFDLGGSFDPT